MYLKFIGEDGSMGLKHGKTYSVRVETHDGYIWVIWGFIGMYYKSCPHSSPQTFTENWAKA